MCVKRVNTFQQSYQDQNVTQKSYFLDLENSIEVCEFV